MRNRTVIVAVLACLLLASACGDDAEVVSAGADETGGAEDGGDVGSDHDAVSGEETDVDTSGEATDGPDQDVTTTQPDELSGPGAVAADLLVADRGVDRDAITVVGVEEVQWSDGSLGCPQPGYSYTQALVPGIQVTLEAAGETYSYHGRTEADLFLCDQPA